VENIFVGIGNKYAAIGKSLDAGFDSTTTLFSYSGEWAASRTKCIIKFISNFYKCAFFYILKIIGNILKIIILLPIKFVLNLFGINADNRIQQISDGIGMMDAFAYSLFGFHIFYFPDSVRKDCFTCVRLKNSAVSKKADDLAHTITTKIPEFMATGDADFNRAKNQLAEMSVLVPREPHKVN
jgi:hypothetical protein